MTPDGDVPRSADRPGSRPDPLAEEAVRLLNAWRASSGAHAGHPRSSSATGRAAPAAGAGPADEDPATGDDAATGDDPLGHGYPGHPAADGPGVCRMCPVCHLLDAARRARPEAVAHLHSAGLSLLAALRELLVEATVPASGDHQCTCPQCTGGTSPSDPDRARRTGGAGNAAGTEGIRRTGRRARGGGFAAEVERIDVR